MLLNMIVMSLWSQVSKVWPKSLEFPPLWPSYSHPSGRNMVDWNDILNKGGQVPRQLWALMQDGTITAEPAAEDLQLASSWQVMLWYMQLASSALRSAACHHRVTDL